MYAEMPWAKCDSRRHKCAYNSSMTSESRHVADDDLKLENVLTAAASGKIMRKSKRVESLMFTAVQTCILTTDTLHY
jgi:hypothetical protein